MSIRLAGALSTSSYIRKVPEGVAISIPATAIDPIFYRAQAGSTLISDDLRHFAGAGSGIDPRAAYSLLQYGALIPPLGLWEGVRQAVPGRTTVFSQDPELSIREEPYRGPDMEPQFPSSPSISIDEQISQVTQVIDRDLMAAARERPLIILFSGGVDSGLVAARASALGLKNTLLVNYAFQRDDPESELAATMARHLGLEFQRIEDDRSNTDIADTLHNAARYYRCPFGDHSAIPTGALVRRVIERFGSGYVVFDATGADGAFGLFGKATQWQKIHALPRAMLQMGSMLYSLSGLGTKKSWLEYRLRAVRRAAEHPYPLAAVAQNSLGNIAYKDDPSIREEVDAMAISWLASICPPEPHLQLPAIDMALVCSQIFAQKSRSLYADSNLGVCYPFLTNDMFRLVLAAGSWQGSQEEPKWVLKAALARYVPREMVYRPKQGFVAPITQKFTNLDFQSAMQAASLGQSPLSPYLDSAFFRKVLPKIRAGVPLPDLTNYFVWTVAFVGAWLEQVNSFKTSDDYAGQPNRSPARPGDVPADMYLDRRRLHN